MQHPVPSAASATARPPSRPPGTDVLLALGALALLATEVLPQAEMTPRWPLLALSVVVALPLAWRAVRPATSALAVCSGFAAVGAVATGPFPPQLAVLPLLVALFSAATRLTGRRAALAAVGTLALVVTGHYASPDGDAGDFWPWLLWAGAWASGTFVRRRTDLAVQHATHASVLEVEARTAAAESAARERDRIARELHDVVAHSVTVMVVQAGAERLRLGGGDDRTTTALATIEETGRSALAELRAMLGVLRDRRDEDLAPLPRLGDVPTLVDRVVATGLPVVLHVEPPGLTSDAELVPAGPSLAAYRIIQEALTNVVRHAGTPTTVRLALERGSLVVGVENAPAPHGSVRSEGGGPGRGLLGMRERVGALGGTVEAEPREDGGFRVLATMPLAGALR